MLAAFRSDEAEYTRCPRCRYLRAWAEDLDPLDLNVSIYEDEIDADGGGQSGLARKKRRKYDHFFDRVARHRLTGRFLDLGCGDGKLLRHASDRGWEAWGVDPAARVPATGVRSAGRGARILAKSLYDCNFDASLFDVVHANEVVEHVGDLAPLIGEIARVLRPGGVVVLRTPHYESWTVLWVRERWRHFSLFERGHVGFCAVATFRHLFAANGLRLLRRETRDFSLRDRFPLEKGLLRSAAGRVYAGIGLLARLVHRGERLTVWGERVGGGR